MLQTESCQSPGCFNRGFLFDHKINAETTARLYAISAAYITFSSEVLVRGRVGQTLINQSSSSRFSPLASISAL